MLTNKFKISAIFIVFLFSFSGLYATRYWVGNGGNWSDHAHWSLTSGGPSGASLPAEYDLVIFDQNSFTAENQIVELNTNIAIGGMDWTAVNHHPVLSGAASFKITFYGPVRLAKEMTNNFSGSIDFIYEGTGAHLGNFQGNEFKGKWEFVDASGSPFFTKKKKKENSTLASIAIVSVTTFDAVCGSEGWAKVNVTGGTPPYTYNWGPGAYSGEPTDSIYGLKATGTNGYSIVVQDALLDADFTTFTINGPNPVLFYVPIAPVNNTCNKSCDGKLKATGVGGTGVKTYLWNDGAAQTTAQALNLCAGNYTLTITDAAGCSVSYSDVVTEPTVLDATISAQTNILCNGAATGSATAAAAGGTAPYTYKWYDAGGTATPTKSSLTAGTYHCEVKDAHGCLDTATVTITQPAAISITATTNQNILCNSVCIGQISYVGSGGTAPLSYSWYDVAGTPTTTPVSNLCAGTYNVQVTDGNGCKDTATTSVTSPGALVATIVAHTDVKCRGLCTGDATVSVAGGLAPYVYDWYNLFAQTTTVGTGMCAGASNCKVTDANGCKDTATVLITQPATTLFANIVAQTNNICAGNCLGDATVRSTGGIVPHTYSWYDAPGLETDTFASSLCTATYHVKITDGNGCLDTASVSITAPSAVVGNFIDSIPLVCNGNSNGSLTVAGSGGTPGYTYLWLAPAGPVTTVVSGLSSGTYSVRVTDSKGCIGVGTYVLNEPTALNAAMASQTNVSCKAICNGILTAGPTGGTSPYTYNWYDDGGVTTKSVSSLCTGTYNVEVTDAKGCLDTATATIGEPLLPLDITVTASTLVTCNGICDGTATVAASGGTAAYTYLWYDKAGFPTTAGTAGLCLGTYHVQTTDANGCKDTVAVPISAPVVVDASITDSTNATCFGLCNGDATVAAVGGTLPYTYDWITAGNQNTTVATNLCSSLHKVWVSDANGCRDSAMVNITQPTAVVASISDSTNLCNGGCTGDATVVGSGGTAPYDYLWYDVAGTPITAFVSSLCLGTYHSELSDANGCLDTVSVNISQPVVLNAAIAQSIISCNGRCDGVMSALPTSGGTIPYTYNWYDDAGQTTISINGLCVVTRNVEVTDANGCLDTATATMTEPALLTASVSSTTTPTCVGLCNGGATAAPAGGTAPYSYLWYTSGNQITSNAITMCAGTHYVRITDAKGCRDTLTVPLVAPVVVVATMLDSTVAACASACTGTATVSAAGGALPYTYNWFTAGNQATPASTGLCAGINKVRVRDANGCVDTASVIIGISNTPVVATMVDSTVTACNLACTGTATTSASGGQAPYTYDWFTAGNQTGVLATALCVGITQVKVTDANGCLDTANVIIGISNTPVLATMVDSTVTACNLACTGTATTSASGGLAPYTYDWFTAGNQTGVLATALCVGITQVKVTDANGCLDTANVIIGISNTPVLATMVDSTVTACNLACTGTATTSASGGLAPYTYDWFTAGNQTGVLATALCVGITQVKVTDANGCLDTANVIIGISNTPVVATMVDSTGVTCFSDCDGAATANGIAGTAPYTYDWFSAAHQLTPAATGLCPGIQGVRVVDANGCFDTAMVVIVAPAKLILAKASNNPTCNGDSDGTISVVASGGTAPYTHSWNNGSTSAILVNLSPGTYIDTVTDAHGCSAIDSVTIIDPVVVQTNAVATTVSCPGMSNAIAYSVPSGGTGPFTFLWNTGSTNDSITGLAVGVYSVTVTDSVGCSDVSSVSVSAPTALALSMAHTDAVCICNGDATVGVAGGIAPYTYKWNDFTAQTTIKAVNLCAGNYRVRVTDANGCKDSIPVSVSNTSTLTGDVIDSIPTSCFTTCDGSGMVAASLGQGPYTYLWNDIASTANDTATNLCAGSYIVQVTDANSCVYNISVTITAPPPVNGVSSVIMPLCFGDCNGTATLVPAGGAGGPYTHSWDTGSINDSIFNLCAATYQDTVRDVAGCTGVVAVAVNQPTLLNAAPTKVNITCFGAANGKANANTSGGTLPYTYLWDNAGASTTATLSGLAPGTYRVTVTDHNGCSDLDSVVITQPTKLISTILDSGFVNCNCVGTATVLASGGTLPYSYLWNDPAAKTTAHVTNLCAGNYTVTISDANLCATSSLVHIVDTSGFTAAITATTNLKCNAVCIGSATITAGGGTLPYSYLWNDPAAQTTAVASSLCAGNYTGKVTDSKGCQFILPTTITQPPAIAFAVITTGVTCTGFCDGKLAATVSGGTGSIYTYSWNDPLSQNTPMADSLCPNTYVLTATDSVGCINTYIGTITEPLPLTAFMSSVTNVSCNGNCNGAINAIGVAGTAPYTYLWNTAQTTKNISGLCPNTYTVTVTDAHGCVDDSAQVITEPPVLNAFLVDSTKITCNGLCNGKATAGANGGTSPYSYSWYDFPGGQNTAVANNLCAQSYHAEITDAKGCLDTTEVNFVPPLALSLNLISKTAAKCNGDCNGKAVVSGSGGTGTLTYSWVGGQTGTSPVTLCAGINKVTMKDSNNCPITLDVVIAEPAFKVKVLVIDTVHLLCASICDGTATASASGGNAGGYTYQWNDPSAQTTTKATGLCAGPIQIKVSDTKGCKDSAIVDINTSNAFTVSIVPTNILCHGDCNGAVKAVTHGGVGNSSVTWIGPGITIANKSLKTVKNLCTGNYIVTAIDQSTTGCPQVKNQFLSDPPLLTPGIGSDSTNILCNGICTGTATAVGIGGTPGYTFKWNDPAGQTTAKAIGLCAGQHKVDVTDANGCVKPAYVNLTQPAAIARMNTTTPALCTNTHEGTIDETVAGGVTPYTYSWTGPAGFTSLIEDPSSVYPGKYYLTIKDKNLCIKKDTAIVAAVTFIDANAGNDTTICNQDTVHLNGSGGVAFSWSTGATTPSITIVPSGTKSYYLTVTSAGCIDKDTVTITVNAKPTADISMAKDIILEGSSQMLFGSGAGIGGTYDWSPPITLNDPTLQNPTATPFKNTIYYLTVTTANGCTDSASALLKVAKGIVFPDGITPNGDGRNDTWVIDLIDQFPQCKVEIFNRWGQQVFQSAGYTKNWDGLFNHIPLPVGTYYYIIDLGPGMQKYTGPITLMR
jgi:gliding motility-associated-like protein